MIILDSDVLSAFLKIGHLRMIKDFYGEDNLYIPIEVLNEIAKAGLAVKIKDKDYIKVVEKDQKVNFEERLGEGEKACIDLAEKDDLLLMNDRKASGVAENMGITTVSIPGLLLAMKKSQSSYSNEIEEIIEALEEKDNYLFKEEEKEKLLQ